MKTIAFIILATATALPGCTPCHDWTTGILIDYPDDSERPVHRGVEKEVAPSCDRKELIARMYKSEVGRSCIVTKDRVPTETPSPKDREQFEALVKSIPADYYTGLECNSVIRTQLGSGLLMAMLCWADGHAAHIVCDGGKGGGSVVSQDGCSVSFPPHEQSRRWYGTYCAGKPVS